MQEGYAGIASHRKVQQHAREQLWILVFGTGSLLTRGRNLWLGWIFVPDQHINYGIQLRISGGDGVLYGSDKQVISMSPASMVLRLEQD